MEENVKITNKQHEKDSEIYGAIMAGAKSRKKRLMQDLPAMETPRGICAVGAGLRGRKKTRWSDVVTKSYQKEHNYSMIRFAAFMEVSENYACGVNDGFENDKGAAQSFYKNVNMNSLDYLRGWHVGQAVLIESNLKSD